MVPSPTHRAAARAARACALGLALTLALGGSRPALARGASGGPLGRDRVTLGKPDSADYTGRDAASTNHGLDAWKATRDRRAHAGSPAGARRRLAYVRGPQLEFPGAHQPLGSVSGPETPDRRGPRFPLIQPGWSMSEHGTRRSDRQIVASRFSVGHSQMGTSRLSTAVDRLLNGRIDRRVQARGFQQPSKPNVRDPLGRAQLVAGARRIMLAKRARGYLEQAAQGMNVRGRIPVSRGALPTWVPGLQDDHTRFVFAELCAGRCGDMKTAGEALRALPASRASISAHREHAHRRSAGPAFGRAGRGAEMADASRALFDGRLSGYWSSPPASGASRDGNAGHTLQ